MQITNLPVSNTYVDTDVIAIETNGVTYKVTGATLADGLKSIGGFIDTDEVANDLTTTQAGKVLDARQGKVLKGIVDVLPCLVVNCGTISSLPATITNANVTSDMVVVSHTLGTPSAQASEWTVTTSDGSLSISGTISDATTVILYLVKSR